MAERTEYPFLKAFGCAAVAVLVSVSAIKAFSRHDATILVITGSLLAAIISAVITGEMVRRTPRAWPMWQIVALFAPIVVALTLAVFAAIVGILLLSPDE